jgi:hypothetical protein
MIVWQGTRLHMVWYTPLFPAGHDLFLVSLVTLQERVYYIGAVEEVWDYAPFGGEMCGSTLVNFSDAAKTFVEPGPDRIGRKYIKALYREFTDDTFTERKVGV